MDYILKHTIEKVYITVTNRQHCRKKRRYIAMDKNTEQLLNDYNKTQKIIYKSN